MSGEAREVPLGRLLTIEGRAHFLLHRAAAYEAELREEAELAPDELDFGATHLIALRLAESDAEALLGRRGELARSLQERFERIHDAEPDERAAIYDRILLGDAGF